MSLSKKGLSLKRGGSGAAIGVITSEIQQNTPSGTILEKVKVPFGWNLSIMTNVGGLFTIPANTTNLKLGASATTILTGTLRLRSESPDGRQAVEISVDIEVIPDPTAVFETTVNNSAQLATALANVDRKSIIYLVNNGAEYVWPNVDTVPTALVTVKSADPANPCRFTSLTFKKINNITVESVYVDSSALSKPAFQADLYFTDTVNNVVIRKVRTKGRATGYITDKTLFAPGAIRITKPATDLIIEESEFSHCGFVLQCQAPTVGFKFRKNKAHHFQQDFMQIGGGASGAPMSFGEIDENHAYLPFGSTHIANHNDLIQFFTDGMTTPHHHIKIRKNVLDIAGSCWYQGILLGNEAIAAGGDPLATMYSDIEFIDNIVRNNDGIGIKFDTAKNILVSGNIVVRADDALYLNDTTDNRVAGSYTPGIGGVGTIGENVVFQNNIVDTPPQLIIGASLINNILLNRVPSSKRSRDIILPGVATVAGDPLQWRLPVNFPAGPEHIKTAGFSFPSPPATNPNEMLSGDFSDATLVTAASGAVVTGGKAVFNDTDSYNCLTFKKQVENDGFYDVKFDMTNYISGALSLCRGASNNLLTGAILSDEKGTPFFSHYGPDDEYGQRVWLKAGEYVGLRGRGSIATKMTIDNFRLEPVELDNNIYIVSRSGDRLTARDGTALTARK